MALSVFLLSCVPPKPAAEATPTPPSDDIIMTDVAVAKLVIVENGEESGYCTVWKVGTDLAMTAGHCCDTNTETSTFTYHAVEGHAVEDAPFEVLFDDDAHDTCIMHGRMTGNAIKLADKDPAVGERVWTAGYPKTIFLISEGRWSGRYGEDNEGKASIAVWGGASGSPVFNMRGEAIGLLHAFYSPMSNMAIIVPIEWLQVTYLLGLNAR